MPSSNRLEFIIYNAEQATTVLNRNWVTTLIMSKALAENKKN